VGLAAYIAASLAVLGGLAALVVIGACVCRRLLPGWHGPPLWVAAAVTATAAATAPALLLGSFGLLKGWLYLLVLAAFAAAAWRLSDRIPASRPDLPPGGPPSPWPMRAIGLAIASVVVGLFAVEVWDKLGTGMTGFDSTWYHGPFAAGFAASGDTFSLHFVAPQFLSWFYPQNSELVHSLGILGFGNDLLSPIVNFGWLAGCLVAAWAIGRPYGGAPLSLAGVALVLGSAAMADQAGEARNDIVGAFFLLAGLAVLVNACSGGRRLPAGPLVAVALAAGLAAGTKINFIPAAIVLAVAAVWLGLPARRGRNGLITFAAVALGGAYWYVRNLIQSGNPLPWVDSLGPLALPAPDQELGGRDQASVLGYLSDPGVIGDWFLPGMADGFGDGWVLLASMAAAGLVLGLWRGSDRALKVGAMVGLALLVAWVAAPTSASGPEGSPTGFVSGLRYLAPSLAVGLALLGPAVGPRGGFAARLTMATLLLLTPFVVFGGRSWDLTELLAAGLAAAAAFAVLASFGLLAGRPVTARFARSGAGVAAAGALVLVIVVAGYGVQSRYFDNRYASPEFTTPGLSEAFVWARGVEGESIATNATRQYPLFGTELDNDVAYLGVPGPRGGFVKTDSCDQLRDAVARDGYRYLVLTLDRESPDRPFPREIAWIEEDPNAVEILKTPPTAIYELNGPLDPDTCP
jgi:hypothetical protein